MSPGIFRAVLVLICLFGVLCIGVTFEEREKSRAQVRERLSRVEERFAQLTLDWNYSRGEWCVNAQKRDAKPGEFVGGCWPTLDEALAGIAKK